MSNQDLSQMGAAQVSLTQRNGFPCIHKQGAGEVEVAFYQHAAQYLDGVNTPRLLAADGCELFLEYIPNSVCLTELQTTSDVFQQLASIHRSQYRPTFEVKRHQWSLDDTTSALSSLQLPQITQDSLKFIQSQSDALFNHGSLISGDSNQGNWGKRGNGQFVLFDWERFGYGSPAIDLAPLVSRMGTLSDYEFIVDHYLHHNNLISRKDLIRQLIIAKSWIVIEVTNILVARNNPQASKYLQWYREQIPTWFSSVEGRL